MKRSLLIFCIVPMLLVAQVQKVAILETVDREGNISYAHKLILRSNLAKAVTNAPGYEAYDRTDMDAIMGEQNFQRTGMVSNEQIKRLGEMTGAAYIMVAEAVKADERNMFITAKILNVETAKTETTENVMVSYNPSDILYGCEMLAYKLLRLSTVGIHPPTPPKRTTSSYSSNKSQTKEVNPKKSDVAASPTVTDSWRTMNGLKNFFKNTFTPNAKNNSNYNSEESLEHPMVRNAEDSSVKGPQPQYTSEESDSKPQTDSKPDTEIEDEFEPEIENRYQSISLQNISDISDESDYNETYVSEETQTTSKQKEKLAYAPDPEPEPEPEPELEPAPEPIQNKEIVFRVSKPFLEFPEAGGEAQIEVTSDEAWEVSEKPSWVNVQQKNNALIVNVTQNERPSDREGDIVLLNEHQVELQIVVAQARNSDYLKLSAQLINDKDGDGGLYTVSVSSNKTWGANTPADWCTTEQTGDNLVIRIEPNKSGESRTTTIGVSAQQSALPKQVITVRQSALSHYIKLHPNIISSSGKSGEATITVETDMPKYNIENVPNWCRISQQTANSFVIEMADNSGGEAREAQIKVAIESGKSETLSVRQAERLNYVTVSPKIISASQRGGVITVNVNGSGAWRVVNIPEWCQVTNQTSDSFTLSIEKNETGAPRNASFSVSVTGVREQIEVRQQ